MKVLVLVVSAIVLSSTIIMILPFVVVLSTLLEVRLFCKVFPYAVELVRFTHILVRAVGFGVFSSTNAAIYAFRFLEFSFSKDFTFDIVIFVRLAVIAIINRVVTVSIFIT